MFAGPGDHASHERSAPRPTAICKTEPTQPFAETRIPRTANLGYLISAGSGERIFHPGDSYDVTPSGIDLLALPFVAPWAKTAMTIDFANAVRPERAIPIHDVFLNETGRSTWMRICRGVIDEAIAIDDPALGDRYTV